MLNHIGISRLHVVSIIYLKAKTLSKNSYAISPNITQRRRTLLQSVSMPPSLRNTLSLAANELAYECPFYNTADKYIANSKVVWKDYIGPNAWSRSACPRAQAIWQKRGFPLLDPTVQYQVPAMHSTP